MTLTFDDPSNSQGQQMKKAKARRWKKRQAVNRGERIAATPETLAKLRPCPLKTLVHAGTMQPDEYEAALLISEAFGAITRHLGYRPLDLGRVGIGHGEMGGIAERLTAIYLAWGHETQRQMHTRPHVFVEYIDDQRAMGQEEAAMLLKACRLWIRCASDYDRARRVERDRFDNAAI